MQYTVQISSGSGSLKDKSCEWCLVECNVYLTHFIVIAVIAAILKHSYGGRLKMVQIQGEKDTHHQRMILEIMSENDNLLSYPQ
jgi:hypothetical protein